MIYIRPEGPVDYPAVRRLVQAAFAQAEYTDHDEHNLVERLRQSESYVPALSLVAEDDGTLVGHILFTTVTVGDMVALALAPLSVLPQRQGQGIGRQLIERGHHEARTRGYGFSILLGHAGYYPRFGYQPASRFGIRCPFDDIPDANFMACDLQNRPDTRLEGMVVYPPAFFIGMP